MFEASCRSAFRVQDWFRLIPGKLEGRTIRGLLLLSTPSSTCRPDQSRGAAFPIYCRRSQDEKDRTPGHTPADAMLCYTSTGRTFCCKMVAWDTRKLEGRTIRGLLLLSTPSSTCRPDQSRGAAFPIYCRRSQDEKDRTPGHTPADAMLCCTSTGRTFCCKTVAWDTSAASVAGACLLLHTC